MIAAVVASALVVLSAVYVSDIPPLIRALFPGGYVAAVAAIGVVTAVLAIAAAAAAIRERRARRFGLLAVAVAGALAYVAAFRTGNVEVDVVEAFHVVEYGLLGALFYRAWRRTPDPRCIVYPLLAGVAVGLADETLQWWVPSRVGEIHDVALNAAAATVGITIAAAAAPPHPHGLTVRPESARPIVRAVTLVLVLVAGFLALVHVGYEIHDPEIGAFRSRYDAATLQYLAADRARAWQYGMPPPAGRFAREDQYRAEALWHVQERNDAVSTADWQAAWRENLILEKYYPPLVTRPALVPLYAWTAEQRAEIEGRARAGSQPREWRSRAEPLPIYVLN